MQKSAFFVEVEKRFGARPEFLWAKFPQYAVFRHQTRGRKWFAVYLEIAPEKLGLQGEEALLIVNLKAPAELIGTLRQMPGIYPAWHMNKTHWLSADLLHTEEALFWQLVAQSFALTQKKSKEQS